LHSGKAKTRSWGRIAMTVARPARASKAVVWMALISVIKILFNYNFRIFNIRKT